MEKIRLGISSCLLGEPVRYVGGHKLNRFLTDTFGQFVEYAPVCPEVECGLSVPREAMHLEGNPDAPRLVTNRTQKDMSERMIRWARKRVVELEKEHLDGFIFKSDSPSSGMERVKIYEKRGRANKEGIGIFARVFTEHFPLLPVEDEKRLRDPEVRENFIERIFTLRRWRQILAGKKNLGKIADFHTRHKLLILSHSPKHYQTMEKLVARMRELSLWRLYPGYQVCLTQSLKLKATRRKNVKALQHAVGYFKGQLSLDERRELLEGIDQYRKGTLPLMIPITLINHYARKYDTPCLKQQVYLNPHPLELRLRNHA